MTPSRFGRFLTLVLAAIQFAAPAVISVADGVVSHRVVDARSHVEDHGQSDCVPPHSADCAVCRYLADSAGVLPHAAFDIAIAAGAPEMAVSLTHSVTAERLGFEARGPPAVAG